MAEIINPIYDSLFNLPIPVKQLNPVPTDARYIVDTIENAKNFAQNGATAYVGELLYVEEDNKLYIIDIDSTIKEVGSKTDGDNKTIILKDGQLSLFDFGKYYYKYIAEVEDVPAHYEKTEGFKDGLQPQIKQISEGNYELAWYEPNPTTVEGLSARISAVEALVNTKEDKFDVIDGNVW